MARVRDLYKNTVAAALKNEFSYKNVNQIPKLEKVVVNAGVGRAVANSKLLDDAAEVITKVTGQKPVITKARKSIAGFKVRQGMNVGTMVTLRGDKMYEFVDRLINITLPRVRDFRGIRPTFDGHGNFSVGIKEHSVFPEISYEEAAAAPVSLQVNIITTAKTDEEAKSLLAGLGFPFKN